MEFDKHLDLRADRPRKNYLAFRCHVCNGRNWYWSYKMVDSYTRNRKIINPVLDNYVAGICKRHMAQLVP